MKIHRPGERHVFLAPIGLLAAVLIGAVLIGAVAQASPPAHILVGGARIFPESLTSSADGSVIIGSIMQQAIFRAPPGADHAGPWIASGTAGLRNVFGVFADDRSNTLWACSNTFDPTGARSWWRAWWPAPATLYAFDLKTGAHKAHFDFPSRGGFCNDIAVARDGTIYATDTNNMQVVRLRKGAAELEIWAGNGAFGPPGGLVDGIAILGRRVLVGTLASSKLFSVPILSDGSAGRIVEVRLDRPLARPDGIRSFGGDSLLIAEGGSGGRLSRVTLRGDSGTLTVLKSGFPDGPVSVTVVGTTAYLLEGQLGSLMRPAPVPDAMLRPFRATAVEVGQP